MAIFPSTNLTRTFIGSFFGFAPPYKLSVLCRASGINPWSWRKPVRYPAIFMTNAIRDTLSGFRINPTTRYLEYDKPTGGDSSPYRIGDFRGYNHDAKRPVNTVIDFDIYVNPPASVPSRYDFSFNFPLPQYDTVLSFGSDLFNSLKGNAISLRLNGSTVNGSMGSGFDIDGKCATKITNLGISANNTTVFAQVKNINIADYGASTIGSVFRIPLEVWYGDADNLDFNRFRIPGGDTVTIQGRVRSMTIDVSFFAITDSSWFPPVNAVRSSAIFTFDALTGVMSVSNLRWEGDIQQNVTAEGADKFVQFKYNNSFRLQYWIYKEDGTVVKQIKDMFIEHPGIKTGTSASVNRTEKTYNVIVSNGFQIKGLERGWRVMFQLNPDPV